jgi:hypothetical protein
VAKGALARAATIGPLNWSEVIRNRIASTKIKLALTGLSILLLGFGVVHFLHAGHPATPRSFVTVDLSQYYNAAIDKSWTPDYGNNHLAALGEGRHDLHGVLFDIHGIIQLEGVEWKKRGYHFPESVTGIRIDAKARLIHLLHANSAFADPPGTEVASVLLHYADGDQARFDIRQGIEVLDWWDWPAAPVKRPTGTNTIVAWRGSNPPAEHQGARIRLFDTTFINPSPEKEIQTIDYVSAMVGSAPFMVALTIER